MSTTTDHELLTITEAADLLRVDRSTIRRWIASGKLHALRPGERTVRLRRSELTGKEEDIKPEGINGTNNTMARVRSEPLPLEERKRQLQYLEYLNQRRKEMSERYGPFDVPGWELLHEAREERDRQLMGEE